MGVEMNENAATHHYHLITGEVFFHMKEKEQEGVPSDSMELY